MELRATSPAKINLFLEILGKRDDGYHDLISVFQTIPLYDTLSVLPAKELQLECTTPGVPTDSSNLILRAASALQHHCAVNYGASFHLSKQIPHAAGLGGGSSNAATALILLNQLWGLKLSQAELSTIGAEIGSDVPFFIYGGVCLCQGRGEIITQLTEVEPLKVQLLSPDWGISTPAAFSRLNPKDFNQVRIAPFLSLLCQQNRDLHALYQASFNRFEDIAFSLEPRQKALQKRLREQQQMARMSGSGSAVWIIPNPTLPPLASLLQPDCRQLL